MQTACQPIAIKQSKFALMSPTSVFANLFPVGGLTQLIIKLRDTSI